MTITERAWCDFVVYTEKGLCVERIKFDGDFWSNDLPKLTKFNDNCLSPEILCPVRNLENMHTSNVSLLSESSESAS
jgi:hypothetical protein